MNTAAARQDQHADATRTRSFCSFWVGGHLFGIDIMEVKEINSETAFTPIFHAPPQVRGYVNIRGQIHLVVDPRGPLGLPAEQDAKGRMLLIFKPAVAENFAMLVDRVGDIISVPVDRIEDQSGDEADRLATGVCKLDGRLLVVLDPRGFLASLH